jgi:hypothetical protein
MQRIVGQACSPMSLSFVNRCLLDDDLGGTGFSRCLAFGHFVAQVSRPVSAVEQVSRPVLAQPSGCACTGFSRCGEKRLLHAFFEQAKACATPLVPALAPTTEKLSAMGRTTNSPVWFQGRRLAAAMPLCGAGNPACRLSSRRRAGRAIRPAGWKAGCSQDWLPHLAAKPRCATKCRNSRHGRLLAHVDNFRITILPLASWRATKQSWRRLLVCCAGHFRLRNPCRTCEVSTRRAGVPAPRDWQQFVTPVVPGATETNGLDIPERDTSRRVQIERECEWISSLDIRVRTGPAAGCMIDECRMRSARFSPA